MGVVCIFQQKQQVQKLGRERVQMSREQNYKNSPEEVCEFILKLSQIMQREPDIISFSEDGKEVIIHEEEKFTKKLLNRYFRHEKWRSFVRQMNMYNFKKINRGVKTYIFINPIFTRDNAHNYHLIRRKIKNRPLHSHAHLNIKDQILDHLRSSYGATSMSHFIGSLCEIRTDLEDSFGAVKKIVDEISKKRKTSDIKNIVMGIKETIQIVEESERKFQDSMERYKDYHDGQLHNLKSFNFSSFSNNSLPEEKETKHRSSNLVIPQPLIPTTEQVLPRSEQVVRPAEEEPRLRPMGMGIQGLSSMSSFTRLINFEE